MRGSNRKQPWGQQYTIVCEWPVELLFVQFYALIWESSSAKCVYNVKCWKLKQVLRNKGISSTFIRSFLIVFWISKCLGYGRASVFCIIHLFFLGNWHGVAFCRSLVKLISVNWSGRVGARSSCHSAPLLSAIAACNYRRYTARHIKQFQFRLHRAGYLHSHTRDFVVIIVIDLLSFRCYFTLYI